MIPSETIARWETVAERVWTLRTRVLEPHQGSGSAAEMIVFEVAELLEAYQTLIAQYREDRERIFGLLSERDHWRHLAEQRIRPREELVQALGVDPRAEGDEQIRQALAEIRRLRELIAAWERT